MHIHALSLKIVVLTYGWGKYGKDASSSTQELDDIAVWCWMISKEPAKLNLIVLGNLGVSGHEPA